ncbi:MULTISPECIES: formylglycine-generating enzyme family protein [Alcaligenes]|uniref:formylglycine-generating enzyme family protein n=1 Tax=Alcaligenes TaxID=507 RepID=UPI002BF8B49F|nr:SUMF1/EgtB/PvdO family nonheme iron enzyme [Alcaligenes faecalis]
MQSRVVGTVLLAAILAGCSAGEPNNSAALPELVEVAGPAREVMQAGEYLLDGRLIASDTVMYAPAPSLKVMKYQVSQYDYDQCVRAERCKAADAVGRGQAKDRPVVGVSWQDGQDYAAWLSERTGKQFRLPDYLEWSYFADQKVPESAQGGLDENEQAALWLQEYQDSYKRKQEQEVPLAPLGQGTANAYGVFDAGGQVAEWTNTCHVRVHRISMPRAESRLENCGVRTLGGEHIAVMPDFIRDPKTGACSVGVPPRYLGLRLVTKD